MRLNWLLGALSVLVALLLWLQVQTQVEPSTQKEVEVPIALDNLPDDLIVVSAAPKATVTAIAPLDQLEEVDASKFSASIDLREARMGTHRYGVMLRAPTRINATFRLRRVTELVTVAKIRREEREVDLETLGSIAPDLVFDEASVEPARVTLEGPDTEVAAVVKVRAMLDLAKVRPGNAYPVRVEALGPNNRPIPMVRVEPEMVTVRPGVAAAPATRRVIVSPVWRGRPAFGYRVVGFDVRPSQIVVSGESGRLGMIVSVDTLPIDLTAMRGNTQIVSRVVLPPGVRTKESTTVRVLVKVEPEPPSLPESGGP